MGSGVGLAPGTVFGGDYQVLRPLSAGGMGAVYVALQVSTARERALKVMLGELSGNEDLKRRFAQEAKVGAQIDSEHVVEVVGAGIDPSSGAPWLAMELLQGEDLASFLAKRGALPPAEVKEIFEQLVHAVGAAHQKQIVHRDLKPENVYLAASRRAGARFMVKVLDFGIAKLLGQARTSATAAMGTPLWMSPEQTQSGSRIAPSADVWALGLIAFKMLAGKPFWKAGDDANASAMMVLREVVFEPIPPASQRAREVGGAALPVGFDAWFARCVNREPSARFQDANEMYDALAQVLSGGHGGTVAAAPHDQAMRPSYPQPIPSSGQRYSAPGSGPQQQYAQPGSGPHQQYAPAGSGPQQRYSAPGSAPQRAVVTAEPTSVPILRPPPVSRPRKQDNTWMLIAGGAVGLIALITVVVIAASGTKKEEEPKTVSISNANAATASKSSAPSTTVTAEPALVPPSSADWEWGSATASVRSRPPPPQGTNRPPPPPPPPTSRPNVGLDDSNPYKKAPPPPPPRPPLNPNGI